MDKKIVRILKKKKKTVVRILKEEIKKRKKDG